MTFFPPGKLLILPSRLAVEQERNRFLEQADDKVVLNPRVYHFGVLEAEMARNLAGTKRLLSEYGQALLIQRLLQDFSTQHKWPPRSPGSGFRRILSELINQLRSESISPDKLSAITESMPEIAVLCLNVVFKAYEAHLEKHNLTDKSGRRKIILERLRQKQRPNILCGVDEIIVQDFNRFTPFQLQLLSGLAGLIQRLSIQMICPAWLLELNIGPENQDHPFNETLRTVRELEALGTDIAGLELNLNSPIKKSSPDLTRLTDLFAAEKIPALLKPPEDIEIVTTTGRYQEVEYIGRRIRRLVDQGIPPEQIVLLCPDLGQYGQFVEDVFRRFSLPLFFRRGTPLIIHPPARALLALMSLANSHWERETVLDILASPYLDLGMTIPWTTAAHLSAAAGVTDERAGGGWRENLERLALTQPCSKPDIDHLIALIDMLKTRLKILTSPQSWSDFSKNAEEILTGFKLDENIRNNMNFIQPNSAAWDALKCLLFDLESGAREAGLSDEKFSLDELTRMLRQAMTERNIGEVQNFSSGIMVLNLFDLHGLTVDYLFIAGLNEGEFPKTRTPGGLISEDRLQALNKLFGRSVFQLSSVQYRQEEHLFYHAVNSVRKKLILSYSRQDGRGRVDLPSPLIDQIVRMWPEGLFKENHLDRQIIPPWDDILTVEELLGGMAVALDDSLPPKADATISLITERIKEHPSILERFESIVERVLIEQNRQTGCSSGWNGQLSPQALMGWRHNLRTYEGAPLIAPTLLESYAKCPFAFWAQYILNLSPVDRPEDEVSPLDAGSMLHRILSRFFFQCRDAHLLPLSGSPDEDRILEQAAAEVWDQDEKKLSVGRTPLWQVRRKIMIRTLKRWLAEEQGRGDGFIPIEFEWSFGPNGSAPPLMIDMISIGRLAIHGRIDRIDERGEQARVIDYKMSSNASPHLRLLKPEEIGVHSFQAPAYQAVVGRQFKKAVTASFIVLNDLKGPNLKMSPSTDSDLFAMDPEIRQQLREQNRPNFYNRLEETWSELTSGRFTPSPDTGHCDYCDFQIVCRSNDVQEAS